MKYTHMHSLLTKVGLVLGILLWLAMPLSAQTNEKGKNKKDKYLISPSKLKKRKSDQFMALPVSFKNLNSTPYFEDPKQLKLINKLVEDKNYSEAIPLMINYVSQFGIENFNRDSELLWQLGQAFEKTDQLAKAKAVYRMVLKHKESDIKYIWQYYDDLTSLDKDYYVPIKYYYELVDYRQQIDTVRPPRGVLVNMGGEVNSIYEDYGPSLSILNDVMMFSSKRNRTRFGGEEAYNEDLYYSKYLDFTTWDTARAFEGEINSPYNEGSPCLTRDGNTLYFVRCNSPDSYGNCDIFQATRKDDGTWGDVTNLGVNVNGPDWDSQPSLSHSEDTIFFVSDRNGGFGSTDIYYTAKGKNGKWMPAENMGPVINTREAELSPFFHPVHNVMYFSSNSQILNFGFVDIFKTYKVPNGWTEPRNIGPLVNGKGDEYYFAIDAASEYIFYARSEMDQMSNLDLFSFPLPMEGQPMAITKFMGSLTDSVSGQPYQGIVSIIDVDNGIEVAPRYIRPDGSFEFDLIDNNRYLLIIQGEDFFRIEQEINLNGDTILNVRTPSIDFKRIEFASVEFASNSSEILPQMRPDLDKLLDFMVDNPDYKLIISGHTDSEGIAEQNLTLSQKRADAIKKYLEQNGGISTDRVQAIGYGSSRPIIKEEKTEEDRWINRRVEFEIIKTEREWNNALNGAHSRR